MRRNINLSTNFRFNDSNVPWTIFVLLRALVSVGNVERWNYAAVSVVGTYIPPLTVKTLYP
jgi:hypothetical protein